MLDHSANDQLHMRLPEGWRDRLKADAKRNGRSLSAEIIQRLRPTIEAADAQRPQS